MCMAFGAATVLSLSNHKTNPKPEKIWITDGKENKEIDRNDLIPEGWFKGKKI